MYKYTALRGCGQVVTGTAMRASGTVTTAHSPQAHLCHLAVQYMDECAHLKLAESLRPSLSGTSAELAPGQSRCNLKPG